jgi:hypothetical protein
MKYPGIDKFIWYINERWLIHEKRCKNVPRPWTQNATLRDYRFCEVRREDDRVTRWLHQHWLQPHVDDPDLWHAMCIARVFNLPSTLMGVGWPEPWSRHGKRVMRTARMLKASGVPIYTSAYNTRCGPDKKGVHEPLLDRHERIFNAVWRNRKFIAPRADDALRAFYDRLMTQFGFGTFMAGQVVADMKWGVTLRNASDWLTFAVSGYGSSRGLCRVCGLEPAIKWRGGEAAWHAIMLDVRKIVLPSLPKPLRTLDAQNIEHALCEYDKICRVDDGRKLTRPFRPSKEQY